MPVSYTHLDVYKRQMWQRFTLYDIRVIGHYLGTLILFSALALVPPLTVSYTHLWAP